MCVDCGSNTLVLDRPKTVGVDGAAASYFCRKHDLYTVRCEHGHTALSYQRCVNPSSKSALRDCYLGCHVAQNEDSAAAGEGPSESSYSDAADVKELISRFTNWKGGTNTSSESDVPPAVLAHGGAATADMLFALAAGDECWTHSSLDRTKGPSEQSRQFYNVVEEYLRLEE